MAAPTPARSWSALGWVLGVGMLLACAVALPLGLDRVGAASLVAAGTGLHAAPEAAPLAALGVRLLGWLPLGDLAVRANLASAAWAALAAGLLARSAVEVLAALRPAPQARRTARDLGHEPVAAAGGALAALLAFGVFLALSAASAVAVTLALVAAAWLRVLRLARAPGSAPDGLMLCLLAGLAPGVDGVAVLVVWPLALLVWVWALRRGERWALLGPLLGVAGASIALFAVAAAGGSVGAALDPLRAWGGGVRATALGAVAQEAAAQLGVVALLCAAVGLVVLLVRVPFAGALVLAAGTVCLLLAAGRAPAERIEQGGAPWALLFAALALPVGAGIAQMASKLGPARIAAAAAIAVIAVAWPALDRGGFRWRRDARLPERLLEQALSQMRPGAAVDPGTPQMRALFEYAAALGLRPDLEVSAPADRR